MSGRIVFKDLVLIFKDVDPSLNLLSFHHRTTLSLSLSMLIRSRKVEGVLLQLIHSQRERGHRTIVVAMSWNEARRIASVLDVRAVASDPGQTDDSDAILSDLRQGTDDVLVGTSRVSHGLDFSGVSLVVHWQGAWNLTALQQAACHAGR